MSTLVYNSKIEIKKSPIHGYGVFAKENIKKDEILEECHFISFPYNEEFTSFYQSNNMARYVFIFPRFKKHNVKKENLEFALPLGAGCVYNSSPNANADWETDKKRRLFIFKSIKNIQKGEEICTNYQSHVDWCKNKKLI